MDRRILAYSDQFAAMRDGATTAPRMATVFLTYGCNFHCAGCHYSAENEDGWQFLDADVLLARLAELRAMGLRSVVFCGGGEPLWHKEIHRIVDGIAALDLRLGVITNGTRLLRDEALRDQLFATAEFVRISIYPETDLAAVAALAHLPRRCTLGAKLLVGATTIEFNVDVAAQLGAAPFDYVLYKAERQSGGALDPLADDELAAIEGRLRGAPRVRGSLRKERTTTRCYLTPVHVMIGAEGNLYLCCFFHGRKERHAYGNLHDDAPMTALWDGPRHREARAAVDPGECSRWDCRFFRYLELAESSQGGATAAADVAGMFDDDDVFI